MKLRAVLSQYALPELRRIAGAADLTVEPHGNKTVLIDMLCRALPAPEGITSRLEKLSAEQRQILFMLAAEGGDLLEEEAIEELCDGFVNRYQAQIDALTAAGLVFRDTNSLGADRPMVGIPDALLKSIPTAEAAQGRLRSIMKTMSIGLLRAFARELDLSLDDTRRPLLIQTLRNALLFSGALKRYLTALSDDKRTMLDLFLSRNSATRREVLETLGETAGRDLEELLWKTPFFYAPNGDPALEDAPIRLAPDLSKALRNIAQNQGGQLEKQLDEVLQTAPSAPAVVQDNAPYLLQDLATLLGLIERKWPRRLKRGGIPKGELRDASRFCHGEADPGYVEFLSQFVETVGLVRPEGAIWRAASDAGAQLEQVVDIRKALFAFWQQTDRWNEWAADRATGTTRSTRMAELKGLRREVIKGLQKCAPETWITYPSFYRFLTRLSETFRSVAEAPGGGRNLAGSGTTADEILRRMLSAALTWMGVVRLGTPDAFSRPLQRSDQATFQITPAGTALLHGRADDDALVQDMPPQNPQTQFIVQPNFEILAPPDLPYSQYLALCAIADLKTQDVMTAFQISREAVQQALNRGMSGEDLRGFFIRHSATGLPDMVDSLITECANKYGEIEIASAAGVLTVDSQHLLDELFAQKRIADALGKRLAPTVAAIAARTKPEALVHMLHQQGYMPHVVRDPVAGHTDRHQVVFTTSEISELVGFLESATTMLSEKADVRLDDLYHLTKRLKRGLRQTSDEARARAADKYRQAFDTAQKSKTLPEEGLEDLLRYTGPNPTTHPPDIGDLMRYAIDHRLRVEIAYGPTEEAPHRVIEPFSEDHAMLYAYCQTRNGDRVFRLEKIQFARLTGERFERAN